MATIGTEEPHAIAVAEAIRGGDLEALRRLLAEHPGLATARLGDDDPGGMSRTLLHVVTDWPGHFPNGATTVAVLVDVGADVNARVRGPHPETPLHWAASSNDVEVLAALLDAGADIEAPGGVIGGGTPLADARAFGQWQAAHRLVARGPDHHRRRRHPRAPGSPGTVLRRTHTTHAGGGQQRLLGRLPQWAATVRRLPAGPGRRPELDPALGGADPPGRGPAPRRRRAGHLARRARGPPGRRAERLVVRMAGAS